jgi:hypothetical protein
LECGVEVARQAADLLDFEVEFLSHESVRADRYSEDDEPL